MMAQSRRAGNKYNADNQGCCDSDADAVGQPLESGVRQTTSFKTKTETKARTTATTAVSTVDTVQFYRCHSPGARFSKLLKIFLSFSEVRRNFTT